MHVLILVRPFLNEVLLDFFSKPYLQPVLFYILQISKCFVYHFLPNHDVLVKIDLNMKTMDVWIMHISSIVVIWDTLTFKSQQIYDTLITQHFSFVFSKHREDKYILNMKNIEILKNLFEITLLERIRSS